MLNWIRSLAPSLFVGFWIVLISVSSQAESLRSPVVDEVHALSPAETHRIENDLVELREKKNIVMVVLLMDTLQGRPISEVAVEEFRKYQIGEKGLNNGLLLVLALKDHKMRLEVGYGLEPEIPDIKVKHLSDDTLAPYLRENHLADGIAALIARIKSAQYEMTDQRRSESSASPNPKWLFVVMMLGLALFYSLFVWLIRSGKMAASNFDEVNEIRGSFIPKDWDKFEKRYRICQSARNFFYHTYVAVTAILIISGIIVSSDGLVALIFFSFFLIGLFLVLIMAAIQTTYSWMEFYRQAPEDLKSKIRSKMNDHGFVYSSSSDSFVYQSSGSSDSDLFGSSSGSSDSGGSFSGGGESGGGGADSSW